MVALEVNWREDVHLKDHEGDGRITLRWILARCVLKMEVVLRVATTEEMKLETCFYHRRKLNARWLKLAEGCVH